MTSPHSPFALPAERAAKAALGLVARDEAQFARIAATVASEIRRLTRALRGALREASAQGGEIVERDARVRHLGNRLELLRRFGVDLTLGRMVPADGSDPVYVGRVGLLADDGTPLLVDWRTPAAEPFFAASHGDPLGLAGRRRYRWSAGRIIDYWDEAFTADGMTSRAALDDQSAFIASLGASRSPRMRDVLGTIQADQNAILRADARGALVVDGGPGTGKTVVALHRAAYLLYADPRLREGRGGVLFIGPSTSYLAYTAEVLPGMGEEGVRVCTLRDLVPESAVAVAETDPWARTWKSSVDAVAAVQRAVRVHEMPPRDAFDVRTDWGVFRIGPEDWEDAFASAEPGTPHNEARDQVWEALVGILAARHADEDLTPALLRNVLATHHALGAHFTSHWPLIDASALLAQLYSRPELIQRAAPRLSGEERTRLLRTDPEAWTDVDLPLLDAAREALGSRGVSREERRRAAAHREEARVRDDVLEELLAADDDNEGAIQLYRFEERRDELIDDSLLVQLDRNRLAGSFAHVIVDEAQELTDAQWQMVLRRCPSRSLTIVGDRAQARHGFSESWHERLARVGVRDVRMSALTVNYRTPAEVMAAAEPVIRAAIADANVPVSVRSVADSVITGSADEVLDVVQTWLATHDEGIAAVIGDPQFSPGPRVCSVTPVQAKGLEYDLVVLVRPEGFGDGVQGAVDRYVAMTRATQRLVLLR